MGSEIGRNYVFIFCETVGSFSYLKTIESTKSREEEEEEEDEEEEKNEEEG